MTGMWAEGRRMRVPVGSVSVARTPNVNRPQSEIRVDHLPERSAARISLASRTHRRQ